MANRTPVRRWQASECHINRRPDRPTLPRGVTESYWDELLRSAPERLQSRVEQVAAAIDVPILAVFGQQLSSDERDHLRRLCPAPSSRWPDRGPFIHLAEADRFAACLRAFMTSARRADAPNPASREKDGAGGRWAGRRPAGSDTGSKPSATQGN